jgi:cytochrome P450
MTDRAIATVSDPDAVARAFDHQSPDLADDPGPTWSILRDIPGIPKTEAHGGFHVVTRYDDVCDVAKRPAEFSSAEVGIPSIEVDLYPLVLDPPVHYEYRQLLAAAFSKREVEKKADSVRTYVRSLLDGVAKADAFDFIEKLAGPLPMQATLEIIGVPTTYGEELYELIQIVNHRRGEEEAPAAAAGQLVAQRLFEVIGRFRAGELTDGAIGPLVNGQVAGRPLSDHDLIATCMNMVNGGLDTTTSALTFAAYHLVTHSEDLSALRSDPALIPGAVDEFVRLAAAATSTARIATVDTQIGGCPVRAGEKVLLVWGSASRDEHRFDHPEDLRIEGRENSHVAFGYGIHRCLGLYVAQMMIRVFLEESLELLSRVAPAPGFAPTWHGGELRGMESLPLVRRWHGLPD